MIPSVYLQVECEHWWGCQAGLAGPDHRIGMGNALDSEWPRHTTQGQADVHTTCMHSHPDCTNHLMDMANLHGVAYLLDKLRGATVAMMLPEM